MKILQVCAYTAVYEGNFIKSLMTLEKKMSEIGYETLYAFPESVKNYQWCKELALSHEVHYLPVSKARIKPKTYLIIRNIFRKHKDIVIAHSHFELYDLPLSILASDGTKVFIHLHDCIGDLLHGFQKYIWKMQYELCSRRSILLSVSEKHKRAVLKLGFNKQNAYIEPNSIDTNRIDKVSKNRNTDYDLLMFGKLYKIKGVDLAEEAVKLIGNKIKLCVVGGDIEKITNTTESYEIICIPQSPDINKIYGSTKCFLHISRTEGMSYALLESLYTGLPVIVSDIEENQIAREFPTAYFVKSESVEQLAECINRLRSVDFSVSENDINESRAIIEKKYSLESWANRIMKDYLTLNFIR